MREIDFECNYCGIVWSERKNSIPMDTKCIRCGDHNIVLKERHKIDYYQGSPPFPEEQEDDEDPYKDVYDLYFGRKGDNQDE